MLQLTDATSYVAVLLLAAFFGAVGGFAAELLLNRGGETGRFELPRRTGHHFDFGGFATLAVGAIAGAAILLVFPPAQVTVTTSDGSATVTNGYDVLRLSVTALVAGSAGGSVLTALQARLSAAIAQADVALKEHVAVEQLDGLRNEAADRISELQRPAAGATGGFADAAQPDEAAVDAAIVAVSNRAEQAKAAVRDASTRREGDR